MDLKQRPWRELVSAAIAVSSLFIACESWAGSVNAFISDGTFINSNSAGNTNGGCGYEVVGNSTNGTSSPTLYGLFKDSVPYMRGREIITSVTLNMQVLQYPGAPSSTPFSTCNGLGLPQGVGNSYQLCQINSSWTGAGQASCEGHAGGLACAAGQPTWSSPNCSGTGWSWTCLNGALSTGTVNGGWYSATAFCANTGLSWCSAVQFWADGNANNGFLVWAPANRSKCYPQYFNKNMYITFGYNCRAGYDDRNGGGSGCGVYCDPCGSSNGGSACVTSQGNSCSDSCGSGNPGYTCGCSGAYTGNNCPTAASCGGGSTSCVNKNECTFNGADPCKANGDSGGTCSDIAAPSSGHNCACSSGFSASNQGTSSATCVGNCPAPVGQSDPCSIGGTVAGTCSVTGAGTWNCNCPTGYVSTGGSHPSCVQFNACSDTANGAVGNTNCKNGVNGNACTDLAPPSTSYTCTCTTGYSNTGGGTPSCVDTNECATNHCSVTGGDAGATCQDHVAPATGYDCTCTDQQFWTQATVGGFLTCVDVDECLVSPSPAPCVHGTCVNVPSGGGYQCGCDSGYVTSSGMTPVCVHPDSCNAAAQAACVSGQMGNACVDNPPPAIGFTCQCNNPAYARNIDGRSCVDKNECGVNHCSDGGDTRADCLDHKAPKSGYDCACSPGFAFDGVTCGDIDECSGGPNPCGGHGSCSNAKGGYNCVCDSGYALKDGACVATSSTAITYTVSAGSGCDMGGAGEPTTALLLVAMGALAMLLLRRRRSR